MSNLVDVLDRILKLYTPVLASMMNENPSFVSLETCIGREDPVAYPCHQDGMGYTDEKFEEKAAIELAKLVEATLNIQNSCSLTIDMAEPFDVMANRVDSGTIEIEATVSNQRGLIVQRNAKVVLADGSIFLIEPAVLLIRTHPVPVEKHIDTLKSACRSGISAAGRYLIDNDLVLNMRGESADELIDWVNEFPAATEAHLDLNYPTPQVAVKSSQDQKTKFVIVSSVIDENPDILKAVSARGLAVDVIDQAGLTVGAQAPE